MIASAENSLPVGTPTDLSSNSSLHVNSDLEDSTTSSIATTIAPGEAEASIETSIRKFYSTRFLEDRSASNSSLVLTTHSCP